MASSESSEGVLLELEALLESCGGFAQIEEFGPTVPEKNVGVDESSCWTYDASARASNRKR